MECVETKARLSTTAIAAAFGLRRVIRVRRLRNSPLGTILLETARGRFVVRRLPPRSDHELKRNAQFLVYMRQHGCPVLAPLTDRNGRYWYGLGPVLWSVHPVREWRLRPLDPNHPPHLRALGESMARYHLAGRGYRKSGETRHTPERLTQLWAAIRPLMPSFLARTTRALDEETEYLAWALDLTKLPRGPLLLDMDPQRFCFQGDRLITVLHCDPDCRGPYIFDLAQAVNRLCFSQGSYDPSRFETLVRAYDAFRLLALLEWDVFPNALRFSAARFLIVGLQRVFLDQTESWAAFESRFHPWFERLRILRREVDGRFGTLRNFMATGYEYRRYQRIREIP
ncbi:MAG: phosphotransferase [Candidatus Binatia bacterium]|nr:phosphotransferase [Candidatus Binatia bacterium]